MGLGFKVVLIFAYFVGSEGTDHWELISRQKDSSASHFSATARTTFLENADNECANTFMKIGNVAWDDYRSADDGKLTFKIDWRKNDGTELVVTFKQTSPPTLANIQGFEAIDTDAIVKGQAFVGLGLSGDSTYCVIDGNGAGGSWWNCVATIQAYGGASPGPNSEVWHGASVYIKVPSIPELDASCCKDFTAECQACVYGRTQEEVCLIYGTDLVGCDTDAICEATWPDMEDPSKKCCEHLENSYDSWACELMTEHCSTHDNVASHCKNTCCTNA